MMSSTPDEHRTRSANDLGPVRCAVLTISDSRTVRTDESGPLIERILTAAGHLAVDRALIEDEPQAIEAALNRWLADAGIQVILTTGGTGISVRDTTIEVVRRLLTVELEGFGELFRLLSFEEVKSAAMLSRAVGGLVVRERADGGETFVFAMPGSPGAVATAMTNLIEPELEHLLALRERSESE